MDELIKRLKERVEYAEKNDEDMDDRSWGMQEGVLISYNEAKKIIALANKPQVILVGNSHISSAEIVKELNNRGLGCLVIGAPDEKDHNAIFRNPAFEPPPILYENMAKFEEPITKPSKNYIDGTRKLPRRNKK